MKHTSTHLVMSMALAALLASPFADAKRVGGGRSSGMQRSSTPSYSAPSRPATPPAYRPSTPPPQYNAPAPARSSGPGIGGAVAAGVAGAAAGYMLGSALSGNDNKEQAPAAAASTPAPEAPAASTAAPTSMATTAAASTPAAQEAISPKTTETAPVAKTAPVSEEKSEGGLSFGTLLLLLIGGAILFMMLKRRKKPATPNYGGLAAGLATAGTARVMDQLNQKTNHRPTSVPPPLPNAGFGASSAASSFASGRLPDGTEVPHFLRQAKATFLHLQSMNNPDNVEEVRKYMTPELFAELSADIAGNTETADFPTLNCDFVSAEQEHGGYVASVRFHGMVSESVNAPLSPFSETWHYVKSAATDNKWLVAGIQQD